MLYTRYAFAAEFCRGKEVLELGCGAGMGLGYLAKRARRIVGGDYSERLLRSAQDSYESQVQLVRLDAHSLPFRDASFDIVLFFEAIYYLSRPRDFLLECRRVLRDTGTLLLCSANKEWSGFSPSALSHTYFSASELRQLLEENDFDAEIFRGFEVFSKKPSGRIVDLIRDFAVKFGLIPKTMRGKEFLKRMFYGRLVELGTGIEENISEYHAPAPIRLSEQQTSGYKVIYAVGRARSSPRVNRLDSLNPSETAATETR